MYVCLRKAFGSLLVGVVLLTSSGMGAISERTKLIEGLKLLTGPVWKSTYNPRQRDQMYEPINRSAALTYRDYNATIFFLRSSRLAQSLSDMIDLTTVSNALEEMIAYVFTGDIDLADETAVRLADAIKADLEKITFQEHRIGITLEKEWTWDAWYVAVNTWAGVSERNFWLDEDDRESLAANLAEAFPENDGKFEQKQFLMMRWGLGDTHVRAAYIHALHPRVDFLTGIKGVFPTARSLARSSRYKTISVVANTFKDLLLERAKEVLIEPVLGNNGHYGVGVWADLRIHGAHSIGLSLHGGVDYLFSSGEQRFFVKRVTVSASSLTTGSSDDQIRDVIRQYVLPEPLGVEIAPGTITTVGMTVLWGPRNWTVFGGYDFYAKEGEDIDWYKRPGDEDVYVQIQEIARKSKMQHKFLGGLTYNTFLQDLHVLGHTFSRFNISFKLNGSTSFGAVGIGEDFALGLGLGVSF